MNSLPYDDDPVMRRAEEIAQRYADQHGHIPMTEERAAQMWDEGLRRPARHRANEDGTPQRPDEATMALLVEARVCWYLGDRDGWDEAHHRARQRLYGQGHTMTSAGEAIRRASGIADLQAATVVVVLKGARERLGDDDTQVRITDLWPDMGGGR